MGDAKKTYNQQVNSQEFQANKEAASKLTFNKAINAVQNQVTKQIKKIPNQQAKTNLIALLKNGAKEAKAELQNRKLLTKNIQETVEKKIPDAKEQLKKAQDKANQAISKY